MKQKILSPILVFLVFTFLFGVIYPAISTGLANLIFPYQSQGSLIKKDNKILGSKLIGQNFSDPKYLWGRLSATSPNPYNAAASSGSNLDPANSALLKNTEDRINLLKKYDPENNQPIPIDLVTSSASGLDPEISVEAALYQAKRIAKFRNISEDEVLEIIQQYTKKKQLGFLGEARVNVLQVNLKFNEL